MMKLKELVTRIENANSVVVNIVDGTLTSFADFGTDFSVNVGYDANNDEIIELVSVNGCTFDCNAKEIESGSFIDNSFVFNHNGVIVSIGIL